MPARSPADAFERRRFCGVFAIIRSASMSRRRFTRRLRAWLAEQAVSERSLEREDAGVMNIAGGLVRELQGEAEAEGLDHRIGND
jgi:hypothetical protein